MKRIFVLLLVALLSLLTTSISSAQTKSRQEILAEISTKRTELSNLEKQFLSPTEQDRSDFAELLSQPNTGLIRLLPREVFDSPNSNKSLTLRGGGAYYSFTRLTHEYGYGSDIELQQGQLSVGFAGCDYGMLARLGSLPLNEVSLANPVVALIERYKPPTIESEVRAEQRRFMSGQTLEGVLLKAYIAADSGMTYVLRSISYDQSDVLVALRVVRRDTDGSVIIAWKILEKFPAPQLIRNNNQGN
jgi:hypothetical protein